MSLGDTSTTPAGWYPDPADDARLRRWDGEGWTQDVILAPEEAPVGFIPPPSTPTPTENLAPPAPSAPSAPATPLAPPASAPPPPPSAAPTLPPPGGETVAAPDPAPAPQTAAPQSAPPTVPRPSPVNDRPNPPSGPVSLPEWATLPGLTLPPDLSSIPGFEPDTIVLTPTFEEETATPALQLPVPDWSQDSVLERPTFEPAPDEPADEKAPAVPSAPAAPNFPPPPTPPRRGGSQPAAAEHYAPPPAGAQYDVPPPPGAARVPGPGLALPASSLVAPARVPQAAWASGPEIARTVVPPIDFDSLPRTSAAPSETAPTGGLLTLWVWLIALLPVIQFAVIYLVFVELNVSFAPGMQWGILAAPAALGLLLASGDRRKLTSLGVDRAPSPLLAIVPPIYLLVRTIDVSRSSAAALVGWFVLQAAAAAGVYYLLPTLLAQAIKSIGI